MMSRKCQRGSDTNLPDHALRVICRSYIRFKYCASVAQVFELCTPTTIVIRRHKVTILLKCQNSKVTEEWATPAGHIRGVLLDNQQGIGESMEEVDGIGTVHVPERKSIEQSMAGLLLQRGERNVITRWMAQEALK